MDKQQEIVGKDSKSKVWLIQCNNKGQVKTTHLYDYDPHDAAPDDWYGIEGILYQHSGEPNVYESYDDVFSVGHNTVGYKMYTSRDISNLEGKLLTLADASFTDENQRKAFKSLLTQTLWRFNGDQEAKLREMFKSEQ